MSLSETALSDAIRRTLEVPAAGRLWRGRSYEDFETTYRIAGNTCEIETLRPLYSQMTEYLAHW